MIEVSAIIKGNLDSAWKYWTTPEHICQWNHASEDWHTPRATNDLRAGGLFSYRMEAKDGSMGFDFEGKYDTIIENELIEYTMGDGRRAIISFQENGDSVTISEKFDPEEMNPKELQEQGWQAILNSFKNYMESQESS